MGAVYNALFGPDRTDIWEQANAEIDFMKEVCCDKFQKENSKGVEFLALGVLRTLSSLSMGFSLANIAFRGVPYLLLTGNAAYLANGVLAFIISHDCLIMARNRCAYLKNPAISEITNEGIAFVKSAWALLRGTTQKNAEEEAQDQSIKASLGYYLAGTWSEVVIITIFKFGLAAKDYYQSQAAKT